jgi:caa(3)-type oxidase subunit IV
MSEHAHERHYLQIWGWLMALLVVSVAGPLLGIQWLTLVTAFGIACVKAYMVAKNFMHITAEQKFITYTIVTCLVFMLLLFAGVAPDVMKAEGTGWEKPAWLAAEAEHAAHGSGGEAAH